tara:strand:- start:76 stop:294 length:219 start_codon:yes stop_codon:yes gene_type:complete
VAFNNYTKKKVNYNDGNVAVTRERAEDIARKTVGCIEDGELKDLVAGLLIREYYCNNKLYREHLERYGDATR